MAISKIAVILVIAALSWTPLIGQASALPSRGLSTVAERNAGDIKDVRWLCDAYQCVWTPDYFDYYESYGPPGNVDEQGAY